MLNITDAARDSFRIRPAVPADADAVVRFIMMAEGDTIPFLTGFSDPAKAAEKIRGWALSPVPNRYSLAHTLVADGGGAAAGAVISFPADAQPGLDTIVLDDIRGRGRSLDFLFFEGIPGTYYLSIMGVDPGQRGRGIGTALMAAAEEKGKALGFARASLIVETDRPRARALYERVGYAAAGEVVLGDFSYLRMSREI